MTPAIRELEAQRAVLVDALGTRCVELAVRIAELERQIEELKVQLRAANNGE